MADPINFLYYLRYYDTGAAQYAYFYVDTAGIVQETYTPTPLPQAPSGWDGQTLTWERGFTYYGVFTNYSNPLRFVNDGAKILKDIYYNDGIEGVCELLITKHTKEVSTWGYVEYYKGDIDFSQYKDMKDFVEVSIMESGFLAKLKANEVATVEIPVETNPSVIWVKMDGIDLQATTKWTGVPGESCSGNGGDTVPIFANYITQGTNLNLFFDNQFLVSGAQFQLIKNNSSVSQDIELTYNYDYFAQVSGGASSSAYFTLLYIVFDANNVVTQTINAFQAGSPISPGNNALYNGSATSSVTLASGETLITTIRMYTTSGIGGSSLFPSAYLIVQGNSTIYLLLYNRVPTTYIPALPATEVAQAVCENVDSAVSTFDQPAGDYPAYLLTCGDALRNLPGSVLKTNFTDYFSAHNCMFNSAFFFDKANNEAQFLYKYFVFDTAQSPIDLGDITDLEVSPMTQEMFSLLQIGYKAFTYDDYNGKDEFNTEYQFKSPLNRVTSTKNLVSPYRADMYGIELTRANLTDKEQADDDSDNDIFWLHIDDSAPAGTIPSGLPGAGSDYYDLYRDNTLTITGVVSPSTAFNIDFSTKRRMYAFGYWIRSMMYPNLTGSMTYKSMLKSQANNAGLETDDGVTIITEKADEVINTLPGTSYTNEGVNRDEIFYPLIFTFKTKIPQNIMDLMTNPHGELSFNYKGNTYYGWLLQVSDEPSFTPKQTYKLICSTSNTLTDLINGI